MKKLLLVVALLVTAVTAQASMQSKADQLAALKTKLAYQKEQVEALQRQANAVKNLPAGPARDQAAQRLQSLINERKGKVVDVKTEATNFTQPKGAAPKPSYIDRAKNMFAGSKNPAANQAGQPAQSQSLFGKAKAFFTRSSK